MVKTQKEIMLYNIHGTILEWLYFIYNESSKALIQFLMKNFEFDLTPDKHNNICCYNCENCENCVMCDYCKNCKNCIFVTSGDNAIDEVTNEEDNCGAEGWDYNIQRNKFIDDGKIYELNDKDIKVLKDIYKSLIDYAHGFKYEEKYINYINNSFKNIFDKF